MYKVKLKPKESVSTCWVAGEPEGKVMEISDQNYRMHHKDNCMEVMEYFRYGPPKKVKCEHCGETKIIREKIIYPTPEEKNG